MFYVLRMDQKALTIVWRGKGDPYALRDDHFQWSKLCVLGPKNDFKAFDP